jgi:hypothetical protein
MVRALLTEAVLVGERWTLLLKTININTMLNLKNEEHNQQPKHNITRY